MSPPPSVKPFGVVSPPLLAESSTALADFPPLSLLLLLELLLVVLLLEDSVARNRMRAACGRATREQLRSIAIVDVATSSSHDLALPRTCGVHAPADCAQI